MTLNDQVKEITQDVTDPLVCHILLRQALQEHSRPCGGCQECCHTMRIVALRKPPHTACHCLCETGCSIHETKPAECKNFYCHWKYHDELPEHCRPDCSGIIISTEPDYFAFYESRLGAFDSMPEEVETYIDALATGHNPSLLDQAVPGAKHVLLVPYGSMGSKHKKRIRTNVDQLVKDA